MKELLAKLHKLKPQAKVGVTLAALLVLGALYNFTFYVDLSDEIAAAEARQGQLRTEREQYEKRKREYLAYRNELTQLQEEQRELLKALPKTAEAASFMASLNEQAELSGVEITSLNSDAEVPEELYVKIPVRVEVRGTFHAITKYFKNLSELRRIVNIESPSITVERAASEIEGGPPKLRAKFVAATFRYGDASQPGGGG